MKNAIIWQQEGSEYLKDLVFLKPNKVDSVPFTTSEVIAEFAGVKHHAVQQLIAKHEADFEMFGVIAFEMRKPLAGSKGGRPETVYHLTEEQSTLLMTYLKNTPQVRAFKKELVRQFYVMRRELIKREVERAKLTPTRRELTDAIRDNVPDSPHKAMWYKHYTDLAYRVAFGKSAAQLRRERYAPKGAVAADYLTADELGMVERVTKQIGVLVEMRLDYQMVKAIVSGAMSPSVKGNASQNTSDIQDSA